MAESKELIHYQNKLCQAYDQLDFSKEPNFQECRNVIISASPVFHDGLQSKYCDLLLDSLTMGYLRYSELMKCDVMKDPCFIEYRNSVMRLSNGDPIKQIYFAVIDLLTGKSGAINKRLAQYVPAKIKRYLDEDEYLLLDGLVLWKKAQLSVRRSILQKNIRSFSRGRKRLE